MFGSTEPAAFSTVPYVVCSNARPWTGCRIVPPMGDSEHPRRLQVSLSGGEKARLATAAAYLTSWLATAAVWRIPGVARIV